MSRAGNAQTTTGWIEKCAALFPATGGAFEQTSPLCQYLLETFTKGEEFRISAEALETSFAVDAFHLPSTAVRGPVPSTPLYTMSLLYVPEYQIGRFILGRLLRFHVGHNVDFTNQTFAELVSLRSRTLQSHDGTRNGHQDDCYFAVARVVLNLDTGVIFSVMPSGLDGSIHVLRVAMGRRGSRETDSLLFNPTGKLAMRCMLFAQCEFCDMRKVDCQCPIEWRKRVDGHIAGLLNNWEDLVRIGKRSQQYFSQTTFQLNMVAADGSLKRKELIENLRYGFDGDSSTLKWMRHNYVKLLKPPDKLDVDLLLSQDVANPGVNMLDSSAQGTDLLAIEALLSTIPTLSDSSVTQGDAVAELCDAASAPSLKQANLATEDRTCKFCGHEFQSKSNMLRHTAEVHQGVKSYKCDICEREFTQRTNLIRHLQSVHMGLKPYRCAECPLTFTTRANLVRHGRNKHPGSTQSDQLRTWEA